MSNKFFCEICNIGFNFNSHFEKHKNTKKHIDKLNNITKRYECCCGKSYKNRQSLYNHRKKCNFQNSEKNLKCEIINELENIDYKSLFFEIVKENKEFKKIIVDQQNQIFEQMKKQDETIKDLIPKVGNNITNNKNKFNINIFLNEQCKNAINMQEFIESIQVSMQDLNYTKQNGLANGLSNIFIDNLNKLPIYERPIHCTDTKRETLYIKQNDKWDKDISRDKVLQALKDLSSKQLKTFGQWINNHDLINNSDDKEEYIEILQIVTKSIKNVDVKIIKKICNNSYIKELLQEVQNEKNNNK
jgi:hypothetical protein